MQINVNEYIGKRFGNVTIMEFYGKYRNGYYGFICKCDCGRTFQAKMYAKDKLRNYCDACSCKIIGEKSGKTRTRFFKYDGELYSTKSYAEKFGVRKRVRKGE